MSKVAKCTAQNSSVDKSSFIISYVAAKPQWEIIFCLALYEEKQVTEHGKNLTKLADMTF